MTGVYVLFAFLIALIVVLIVWQIIVFIQNKRGYIGKYNDHEIIVRFGIISIDLIIDGKICDEMKSWFLVNASLNANVDDIDVKVRIGTGFLKPIIRVQVNGQQLQLIPIKRGERREDEKQDK